MANILIDQDEGIVQLTNSKEVAKAIVRSITDWSKVRILLVPQI